MAMESIVKRISKQHVELGDEPDTNSWSAVLDTAVTVGGNGFRMPLNDKKGRPTAGDARKYLPQDKRPKRPLGVYRLDRASNRVEQVLQGPSVPENDAGWVHCGLCRCAPDTPLAPWTQQVRAVDPDGLKKLLSQYWHFAAGNFSMSCDRRVLCPEIAGLCEDRVAWADPRRVDGAGKFCTSDVGCTSDCTYARLWMVMETSACGTKCRLRGEASVTVFLNDRETHKAKFDIDRDDIIFKGKRGRG